MSVVEQDRTRKCLERKLNIRFSFAAGLLLGDVHSVVYCLHYPSNYCLYRMGDLAHYQEGGGVELRPNWGFLYMS